MKLSTITSHLSRRSFSLVHFGRRFGRLSVPLSGLLPSLALCGCILSSAYAEAPRVVPSILDSVPHETSHFTQGLSFDGKEMIETTGLYGKSGLYRRTLEGKILDSARLEELSLRTWQGN